jgi:hypothetical protein
VTCTDCEEAWRNGTPQKSTFVEDVGKLLLAFILRRVVATPAHRCAEASAQAPTWDPSGLRGSRTPPTAPSSIGPPCDPADPTILQFADAISTTAARIRAGHTSLAWSSTLHSPCPRPNDETWARFELGTEYGVKDPTTQQPATRNPFWHRAPSPVPEYVMPTLKDFFDGGGFGLVCDFALGHLARRLATKRGTDASAVHAALRAGIVQHA